MYAITSGLQGVILYESRLNYFERVVLFIAGCVLIAPLYWETLIGLIVLIVVQGGHLMKARKIKVAV